MKMHPVNLALRFVLEMSALAAMVLWGMALADGWAQYLFAIGVPFVAAFIWGIFNVPGDPSRSGNAPVVVSGAVRLAIELIFFTLAAWMLHDLSYTSLGILLLIVVNIHYITSYRRISWLLSR